MNLEEGDQVCSCDTQSEVGQVKDQMQNPKVQGKQTMSLLRQFILAAFTGKVALGSAMCMCRHVSIFFSNASSPLLIAYTSYVAPRPALSRILMNHLWDHHHISIYGNIWQKS